MVCETVSRNIDSDNQSDIQYLFEKYEQMRNRYDDAVKRYGKEVADAMERCDYLNARIDELQNALDKARAERDHYQELFKQAAEATKEVLI